MVENPELVPVEPFSTLQLAWAGPACHAASSPPHGDSLSYHLIMDWESCLPPSREFIVGRPS